MTFTPHPGLHPVFETLGYASGYALYKHLRARAGDFLSDEHRWLIIASTALGALAGSRILGLLEQAPRLGWGFQQLCAALFAPSGGKTIVGGLLGGWLVVELAKLVLHVRSRTGDLFAVPLCLGIAIGRIGCFVAGLADDTYGTRTTLPWGVDFGDGVSRHPTQLYELVFLLALAAVLTALSRRPHRQGALFRVFMAAYLSWRLLIDFLKPQPVVHGLNFIQWSCVAGLVAVAAGYFTDRPSQPPMRKPTAAVAVAFLLLLLFSPLLRAQAKTESTWPKPQGSVHDGNGSYGDLLVLTAAQPTVRHRCAVQAIDAGQIVCGRRFGRKPQVYQRAEIDALLLPGAHPHFISAHLPYWSIGGAVIVGGIYLTGATLTGGVVVMILGGFFILDSFGFHGPSMQRNPESIVYLRPDARLQVQLAPA